MFALTSPVLAIYNAPPIPAPPPTTRAPVVVEELTVVFAIFADPTLIGSNMMLASVQLIVIPGSANTLLNNVQVLSV